jgi:two-component system sensor histidine kinase TctE
MALLAAPPARAAAAADATLYPAVGVERERLRIHSATDRSAIEPLLQDFQALRPDVAIEYLDLNTNELYASVVEAGDGAVPDLVISSAMDLQVKLVNDGHTRPHRSDATLRLPDWANWRDEAFGFTYEPVVIVYNRDLVAATEVPRSRSALIRLLREQPERYRRRVATYDIGESGVGYLFAAHDSVLSSQFWRLVSAFGSARVRLFPTSGAILDAIERGEVLIGYNVLGSYARTRRRAGAPIGIVLPDDFTLVMSRVAVIPMKAEHPELARLFVDYVLSDRGQAVIAGASGLYAIAPQVEDGATAAHLLAEAPDRLHPIALGPALLTFADRLRKTRFLADWRLAIQPP